MFLRLLGWILCANLAAVLATLLVLRPWDPPSPFTGLPLAELRSELQGAERATVQRLRAQLHRRRGLQLLPLRGNAPPGRLPPRLLARIAALEPGESLRLRNGDMLLRVGSEPDWLLRAPAGLAPRLRLAPLSLLLLALLAFVGVAWFAARRLDRPLHALRRLSAEVSGGAAPSAARAAGRAPTPAPSLTRRRDAIGALAREMGQMQQRLAAGEAARIELTRDLSHELRSPLARMQVALALAQERDPSDPRLHSIEAEIGRLDGMIGELLQYSALQAEPPLQRTPTDLAALFEALRSRWQEGFAQAGVALQAQSPDISWPLDERWVERALDNLLRNALRACAGRPQAAVALHARRDGEGLELEVSDNGPGVPADQLSRLFEPLGGERAEGFGLGLAVVRRVALRHGGDCVASRSASGGLSLRLRLPRHGPEDTAPAAPTAPAR